MKKHVERSFRVHAVLVACAVVTAVLSGTMPAPAESATTTWTTYIYQGPGPRYSVVTEVPQASRIDVIGCANAWCQIVLGDKVGYLQAEVIARTAPAAPSAGVLAQPAAAVDRTAKLGDCFGALQTSGNGGHAQTIFCQKPGR